MATTTTPLAAGSPQGQPYALPNKGSETPALQEDQDSSASFFKTSKTEIVMANGSNGGDSAQKKNVTIDTRYLKKEDLQALKEHDPFLYYSIPGVRAATIQSNRSVDMSSLQGGNIPRRATFASRTNSTPTKVERQTRISFECHVDLLLDDRMNEWPFGGDDEEELDAMIDKLLQHGMSSRRQSRP